MTYISYPIEKAAQATRIFGAVLFVAALVSLLFTVIESNTMPPIAVIRGGLIAAGVFVVAGGGMLLLGGRIELAARWAMLLAMAIAAAIIAYSTTQSVLASARGDGFGSVGACIANVMVAGGGIYVIVRGWNALPEFRFLKRGEPPAERRKSVGGMPPRPARVPPPASRLRASVREHNAPPQK
jgi:hypothetical protein